MPISLRFDPDKGILYARVSPRAPASDLLDAMRAVVDAEEYSPDVPTLWDMREFDFSIIDGDYFRRLIEFRKEHPERGTARLAAVVSTDLGFGMSRMYELMSEVQEMPQQMRIFRDLDEAERWLLEPD